MVQLLNGLNGRPEPKWGSNSMWYANLCAEPVRAGRLRRCDPRLGAQDTGCRQSRRRGVRRPGRGPDASQRDVENSRHHYADDPRVVRAAEQAHKGAHVELLVDERNLERQADEVCGEGLPDPSTVDSVCGEEVLWTVATVPDDVEVSQVDGGPGDEEECEHQQ